MEHLGLVGLPNAGKTSLFNALTGARAPVAPHPFTTTETSVAVAPLPDPRLDALATMSASRKVVRAGVEVVDIAGIVSGSSTGEGMGNRFLAGIREADALCLVLRAFEDPEVVGDTEPLDTLGIVELELVLADVATLDAQIDKRRKAAARRQEPGRRSGGHGGRLRGAVVGCAAVPGRPRPRPAPRRDAACSCSPTSPCSSSSISATTSSKKAADLVTPVMEALGGHGEVLGVCLQLEAEASMLSAEERAELLEGLGLGEGALARVARAAYGLLGRRVFFTTGDKESRAWSFRAGATAPECAGVIHSDLQRGFIRAEVIHWDELVDIGSWAAAKAAGRIRLEGKEYQVADGDVLEIRFNV